MSSDNVITCNGLREIKQVPKYPETIAIASKFFDKWIVAGAAYWIMGSFRSFHFTLSGILLVRFRSSGILYFYRSSNRNHMNYTGKHCFYSISSKKSNISIKLHLMHSRKFLTNPQAEYIRVCLEQTFCVCFVFYAKRKEILLSLNAIVLNKVKRTINYYFIIAIDVAYIHMWMKPTVLKADVGFGKPATFDLIAIQECLLLVLSCSFLKISFNKIRQYLSRRQKAMSYWK